MKRYDIVAGYEEPDMALSPDGLWVRYREAREVEVERDALKTRLRDIEAAKGKIAELQAECDRLRSRVAVLEARPENAIVAGLEYKAAQLRAERDAAIRERDELRSDLRQIAATCGGAISPEASHEFHRHVPAEVAALAAKLAEYKTLVVPAWKRDELAWEETEARLTQERDEAIGALLDCAPDGANAYPVGMEGVYLAAEKINAERVALLQESARRLEIIRRTCQKMDVRYSARGTTTWDPSGARVTAMMEELDAAGLLEEIGDLQGKRVRG